MEPLLFVLKGSCAPPKSRFILMNEKLDFNWPIFFSSLVPDKKIENNVSHPGR